MTEYFYRDELGQYFDIASSSLIPSSGTYYRLNLETGMAINGYSLDEIQGNNYIGWFINRPVYNRYIYNNGKYYILGDPILNTLKSNSLNVNYLTSIWGANSSSPVYSSNRSSLSVAQTEAIQWLQDHVQYLGWVGEDWITGTDAGNTTWTRSYESYTGADMEEISYQGRIIITQVFGEITA